MRAALERDMPVLAICRGSQLLNVARGGDLVQHLPEIVGDDKHKVTPGVFAVHDVAVEPESRLGSMIGPAAHVESHHHQGIGRSGTGLEVVAYADDGTAEAVEDRERRFTIGVLWHPEEGEDLRLFQALVEQAKGLPGGRALRAASTGSRASSPAPAAGWAASPRRSSPPRARTCASPTSMLAAAEETVGLCAEGSAFAFEVDVADEGQVAAMMRAAAERFGGIDVLYNNAGISPSDDASVARHIARGLAARPGREHEGRLPLLQARDPVPARARRRIGHQRLLAGRARRSRDLADLLHGLEGRGAVDEPRAGRRSSRGRASA